jgi:hypothetical protein
MSMYISYRLLPLLMYLVGVYLPYRICPFSVLQYISVYSLVFSFRGLFLPTVYCKVYPLL